MKKILLFLTAISIFLYACKEETAVTPKSAAKQLLTFKINNVVEESNTVDQTSRNIRIVVPAKTDRKALTPTITLSAKATVSPATGIAQDFTNAVKYTVTAEDGSTQVYNVVVDVKMSSEKVIAEFKFSGLTPEVKATITGTDIVATVPSGTNVKTLVPTIMLSAGATVSPESGKASDFSNPAKFTVTAEDGTKQDYTVKITVAKSTEKQITEFRLAGLNPDVLGTIDQTANTISATVPAGTNLKTLIPTIKLSALATVATASGVAQDFTNTVNYTVKAEDGTTQVYKVTVTVASAQNTALSNMVFIGSSDSKMYALNVLTGAKIWEFSGIASSLNGIRTGATVSDGSVFFAASWSKLYSLDGLKGTKNWEYLLNDQPSGSPIIVNGVVYAFDYAGYVYAIDAITGIKKWEKRIVISSKSANNPTVVDGVLYIVGNTKLFALNSSNGNEIWNFDLQSANNSPSSPAVVNGVVYVGANNNSIYAIDAKIGTKRWSLDLGSAIEASPTIANGILYINGSLKSLHAVDLATEKIKWTYNTGDRNLTSPYVYGGSVFTDRVGSTFSSVDALKGTENWFVRFPSSIASSPVVVDGTIYAGCYDNKMYAFNTSDGKVVWSFLTGNKIFASPCVVDKKGQVFHSTLSGSQQ